MLQSILLLLVGRYAFAEHDLYDEIIREAVNSEDEDRTAYSGSTKSSSKGKGSSSSSKGGGDYDYGVIFEKTVIVDFDGVDSDPDELSFVSPGALEMEFVETYNHLSEYLCDVDGVEILEAAIHVDESGEYVIKRGGSYFSLQFDIIATCNNCTDGSLFELFVGDFDFLGPNPENCTDFTDNYPVEFDDDDDDDGFDEEFVRARALKASKKASKKDTMPKGTDSDIKLSSKKSKGSKGSKKSSKKGKGGKGKGKGGGDRICTSSCPAYRAPTHEEFRLALDTTIKEYSGKFSSNDERRRLGCDFMSGNKLAIDRVAGVREMLSLGLECTDEAEELIDLVTVEMIGDYSQVTDEEKVELEKGFVQRYNAQTEIFVCDYPYFRELNSAEIKMVATGDADPGSFHYVFKLNGTCHGAGCSDEVGLFNLFDPFSFRRLEHDESNMTDDGFFFNMTDDDFEFPDFGDCPFQCSSSSEFGRGVLISDFEEVLFTPLTLELIECGSLTNIQGSGEIKLLPLEPAPTAPPTITATPTLSAQPSESAMPSETPTTSAAPSSSPTSAPSTTPSSSPSSKPSATPSSSPSGSRGPSLSSSPSLSDAPSGAPTVSEAPSSGPSSMPSGSPTTSSAPSSVPSSKPSVAPSSSPSSKPSAAPSSSPSISTVPSLSAEPSATPSLSAAPSLSASPSVSAEPSATP